MLINILVYYYIILPQFADCISGDQATSIQLHTDIFVFLVPACRLHLHVSPEASGKASSKSSKARIQLVVVCFSWPPCCLACIWSSRAWLYLHVCLLLCYLLLLSLDYCLTALLIYYCSWPACCLACIWTSCAWLYLHVSPNWHFPIVGRLSILVYSCTCLLLAIVCVVVSASLAVLAFS